MLHVSKFISLFFFSQVEDDLDEIDPGAIQKRRTRGNRVDYTSKEALKKAGLQEEENDDDVEMKT